MAELRAAIVLASAGRPGLLAEITADLARQTAPISVRLLSVPDEASLPDPVPPGWEVATGARGLAAQRNAGIDALGDRADVVFFFDDDAVVRADYVANGLAFFAASAEVVGLTGRVLLDGAARSAGEVSREAAVAELLASEGEPLTGQSHASRTLYGCNFAYRKDRLDAIRFDGRLPLYSWLEDHDFARRLLRHGLLASFDDCVIVHRGASSGGRTNHVRLGYTQVMNPVYLKNTGSFPLWLAAWETFRPVAKNVVYAAAGPQRSWRRERLRGNMLATGDVLRGRITPERMAEL